MQVFRVFVSSPQDASVERRRVDNVVSRLNGELAGQARLEAIRWEREHYLAHTTFQTQIPPAAQCDLVVGVLRWRLGQTLPDEFPERLPGGEPYPSGTAYELLTAIEKRRAGAALPDVFVFKYDGGKPKFEVDDPEEEKVKAQWHALGRFFERWFVNPQGQFKAAFNAYQSEDDFEAQLDALLRKWLAARIAGGRILSWPPNNGSPFRGLDVFGARHAPVFFGRAADIRRALDLWREAASREVAFLLLVGASGAGKSSLARAGLMPRLTTPGVEPRIDAWRVAALRPGDRPGDPFAALAEALVQREADLPAEEAGRGPALPEILDGDSRTPAELAALLAHADAAAVKPVINALERLSRRMGEQERIDRPIRCDLVLLVDQLEELFAPSFAPEMRERFATLLAALVATGRVWLVATLRADLYAALLDIPSLKRLKDAGASYDLAPPGAAELAEIVRAPAAAAGLVFETDPASDETLDERLLREAERPDMLPLVQLALSRLWEARESRGEESVLTIAAFERLGGLKGIVAEAGEAALRRLGEAEAAKLAPLIRELAEVSKGGTLTARAVPLAEAAADAPARRLVEALVGARLLTLTGEGGAASLRLAHQRVLTDWERARTIVAESGDFYRIRDEVEDRRRRWEANGRKGELLLARGLPLAEARKIAEAYGAELSPEARAFIAASRLRANRAQVVALGAAGVFALLAIGAGLGWRRAADERRIATRDFHAALTGVNDLVFNIAQGLRNATGMRVGTTKTILDTAQRSVNTLLATEPHNRDLLHIRSAMLDNFVKTYLRSGDIRDAAAAAKEKLASDSRVAAQDPGNAQDQRSLGIALQDTGDVKQQAGDLAGATLAYREELAISRKLAAQHPGNAQAQKDVAVALERVGDVKLNAGDLTGATLAYRQELAVFRKLAAQNPGNAQDQRSLGIALQDIGNVRLKTGDLAGATRAYRQMLGIDRNLAAQDPGNAQTQQDVAADLGHIGDATLKADDLAGATRAYRQMLAIARKLAAQDPSNAEKQRSVAIALERIGDVKLKAGHLAGATRAYRQMLAIDRKLAAQDPSNAQNQRAVAIDLANIGDVKHKAGDRAGALADFRQSLAIFLALSAKAPTDAGLKGDLGWLHQQIASLAAGKP